MNNSTSRKHDNLRWMKFWPGDWRTDDALASCSAAARGVWIELLCLMWTAPVRGVLPNEPRRLARLARVAPEEMEQALEELSAARVFSSGDSVSETLPADAIVSRRMWREWHRTVQAREAGRRGGVATGPTKARPGNRNAARKPKKKQPEPAEQTPAPAAHAGEQAAPAAPAGEQAVSELIDSVLSAAAAEQAAQPARGNGLTARQRRWVEEQAQELAALKEGGAEAWEPWFTECVRRYVTAGGSPAAVEEILKTINTARDPDKRHRLDVGIFEQPGRWATKQLTGLLKAHRLKWPQFPS
jgi:hypothetical protein